MHHRYDLNWQGQKVSNRPIMNGDKDLVSQQKLCLPKRFKAPFPHFSWESRKCAYYVHVGDHLTNPLYKIEYKSFSSSLLTTHKLHTPSCCACKNFWMMDRVISILAQTTCSIPLLVSRPPPLNIKYSFKCLNGLAHCLK